MVSYGQFCPVARAAEIVAQPWTPLILRDLLSGPRRFNQLQRGVPMMSPTLLSRRLKALEAAGVVERRPLADASAWEYRLTSAGEELRLVIMALGVWGQRWVRGRLSPDPIDGALVMFAIGEGVDCGALPRSRLVVEFNFTGEPPPDPKRWWLLVEDRRPEICIDRPGFEPDLYVTAEIGLFVSVWMGERTLARAVANGDIELEGDRALRASIGRWLTLSPFAQVSRAPGPFDVQELLNLAGAPQSREA